MSRIFYLGFFENTFCKEDKRTFSPAAEIKQRYLVKILNRIGLSVTCISEGWSSLKNGSFKFSKYSDGKNEFVFLKTFGSSNKIFNFLKISLLKRQFAKYCAQNIKKDDIVFAYHSIPYAKILLKLKNKIGFKLIYEVEELYQNAIPLNKTQIKLENNLISSADALIVVSDLLSQILKTDKDKIVYYGPYNSYEAKYPKFSREDKRIHLVYSGTFDMNKGGCINAINAVKKLSNKFVLHILGFGTEEEKRTILALINEINAKNRVEIVFDGLLLGEEFINFLCRCDFGLSLQNKNNVFSNTSFPSKLLTYLGCGLNIISTSDECVCKSKINDFILYEDEGVINEDKLISYVKPNSNIISLLDKEFENSIKNIVIKVNGHEYF